MGWSLPVALPSSSERWASVAFQEELRRWVADHVGSVRAMDRVKLRPWSAVWRVEADDGIFYAKQNCPLQNFEAALVAELQSIAPADIVPLAAVDTDRGFLLTPDQGPVLWREGVATDLGTWTSLLVAASRFQREVVPQVDDLETRVGLTRMPPEQAGQYAEDRLEALSALPGDDPRRLDPEVALRVRALIPVVEQWGEQVAALGLPLSLHHNDLHENNAFDTPTGLRFFDFGDTVVAHPLEVLLVPFAIVTRDLEVGSGDPSLWAVADAALEVWSDLASMRDLRAALPAALQLGRLARVESWLRCAASMTPPELAEYGSYAAVWLGTLAKPPPLSH